MIHRHRSQPDRALTRRRHAVHPHHGAANSAAPPRRVARRHDEAHAATMTTTAANVHRNYCPEAPEHAIGDRPVASRSASSWEPGGVTAILRADLAHEQTMEQACRTLRAQVPPAMLDLPWPSDRHDVRIRSDGRQVFTMRLRVTGADSVDIEAFALPVALAEAVARALGQESEAEPVGGGWASTGPVAEVSTALLPQAEMDTIAAAPTPVAVFDRGAWVHTIGATTTDTDAGEAWQEWPTLRAVLLRAAQTGIGWVLFDADGPRSAPDGLPLHD